MSKLTKLINSPGQFVHDMLLKRLPISPRYKEHISDYFIKNNILTTPNQSKDNPKQSKPIIFIVGFSTWKNELRKYFKNYELIFLSREISRNHFIKKYRWQIINSCDNCEVLIWGYKAPDFLLKFLQEKTINTYFVEDGFIRSVGLGASKVPPLSLCMDSKAPYFDAQKSTDIEDLLNTFDCSDDLLERANSLIKIIKEYKISKYNHTQTVDVEKIYTEKTKKRILVIGQVEDDASVLYGCNEKLSNNDLVRLAAAENPDADIIYKVHPDVLNGHRDYQSSPDAVRDICQVITDDISLADSLKTIDHVYTITSLSGLEALLYEIPVTTIGLPFYSGWGLTDDRQSSTRRKRKRNLAELVAICYLVYPRYFDGYSGRQVEAEDVVQNIIRSKLPQPYTFKGNDIFSSTLTKGIYTDKNNNLLQVLHIANQSETGELLVVYQNLYGKYDILVSPIEFFIKNKDGAQSQFKLVRALE